MNIDEMEAGPELDEAVAKACGVRGEKYGVGFCRVVHDERLCKDFGTMWQPSSELNAAYEAAKIANLFPDHLLWQVKTEGPELWYVSKWDGRGWVLDRVAQGPTPAVAICRAIVKLAKDETRHLRQG